MKSVNTTRKTGILGDYMKIKYANVDDKGFSSFAYIICEENGKLFSPVYNKRDRVAYFTEVEIVNTYLIDAHSDVDLRVGDRRIFAYYCDNKVYIGDRKEISKILFSLLGNNKIRTPFSMLEVIQFLNVKGKERQKALDRCHSFLVENASPEGVKLWEDCVKYKEPVSRRAESAFYDPKDEYVKSIPHNIDIIQTKARQGSFTLALNMREGA